jgi:hypothetical protein
MLDFVFGLERVISKWPANSHQTVTQIAELAEVSIATAVDALAISLSKELDVQDVISAAEAKEALASLQDRLQVQIAARQRRINQQRDTAIAAYDLTMEKVRALLAVKNGRNAYKTLSYFVGRFEADLPLDLQLSLCGDCLRLGSRTDANMQELAEWLKKGVALALTNPSKEATLDALDFIDAASDYLLQTKAPQATRLLAHAMATVSTAATQFELDSEWQAIAAGIQLPAAKTT